MYAERSGVSGGCYWRASSADYYEGAVIAAAAGKPNQGIGFVDGDIDYVIVCDGEGAWGVGRLIKTFPVKNSAGGSVRRALIDPTDVHADVMSLVEEGFKPVGPKGGTLRQSMRAVVVDGQVILGAEGAPHV